MDVRVNWVEEVMFVAESETGHALILDGPSENGGRNMGMELMALSVGSCSSYDVVTILQKGRQQITSCEANVTAKRADAVPAVFESIHLHFKISGRDLSERLVERAIELSAEKYCSASIMLKNAGVDVTHDFEIVSVEAADE